ncbi:MAG: helix-turn-helix domain-containing protein [Lachnospirales bacterium]
MIVYEKLMNLLSKKKLNKRQLSEAIGIKANTMSALSKNRNVNMETINRICEYLQVQPSEIIEWIPDEEYKKSKRRKNSD